MKKYYLNIILVISAMIIMVLSLDYMSENKIDIKVISGDIKNIGDVEIVYSPAVKDLIKEEIIISKEGIKNRKVKGNVIGRDYSNIDKKYNEYLKFQYNSYIFQDERYIGYIDSFYDTINDKNNYIKINRKDKSTDKEEIIKVPIKREDIEYSDGLLLQISFTSIYKDNIYALAVSHEENTQVLSILKINLSNKTFEKVEEIKLEEKENGNSSVGYMMFNYDNKLYVNTSTFSQEENYINFIIYDMKNNKINIGKNIYEEKGNSTNLYNIINYNNLVAYNIYGNNLILLTKDTNREKISKISKIEYTIKNDEIAFKSKYDYKLSIDYEYYFEQGGYIYGMDTGSIYDYDSGIRKIKLIDDKIYLLYQKRRTLNKELKKGESISIDGNMPVNLKVFDINKNETVFEGEIINGDKSIGNELFITK